MSDELPQGFTLDDSDVIEPQPLDIQSRTIERLQKGNLSKEQLEAYNELKKRGHFDQANEEDIPQGFKVDDQQQKPSPLTVSPEEEGILAKIFGENNVRPILEFGGMLGGGTIGTGIGPQGTVAGAGLGYAAGKGIADKIYDEPETFQESAIKTGKDVATGAAMEMGGSVVGKILSKTVGAIGSGAKNILGKLTGAGTGAIDEAVASGAKTGMSFNPLATKTSFDKALRGEITGPEIASHASISA